MRTFIRTHKDLCCTIENFKSKPFGKSKFLKEYNQTLINGKDCLFTYVLQLSI